MSRALCITLREVCHVELSVDEKTLQLMQVEKKNLLPLLNVPRELEKLLFGPRNEGSPSHTGSLSDPVGGLKSSSDDYQLGMEAGSPLARHPARRVVSRESQPQLPSTNRIRLPEIIKKKKTQVTEELTAVPEDSFRGGHSNFSLRRHDIYKTDAELLSMDGESGGGRIPQSGQVKFVLAMPKRGATALPEVMAMRKETAQANAENTLSRSVGNCTLSDLEFASLKHAQSVPIASGLLDVSNVRQRLSGNSAAGSRSRIVPLSLARTSVGGCDVDHSVDGTGCRNSDYIHET
ncbi:unnamed protein product [Phytomonas sp. EM1]|nr:unnamed protein product [Phytomonas sp. EM1]|eukprot:CCW61581.1 unnamed protein product [Phytomonas sp. isolate EM1]